MIYNPDDSISLEVRLGQETVWLTQAQMGKLFGVDRTVIVHHIGKVYKCGELEEVSTCAKIAQVHREGGRKVERKQKFYSLDMILSVDRFLITDDTVYHVGASIKDLGKKWFAFSVLNDITPDDIISKI